MQDEIIMSVLAKAASVEGSTQALATRLKAPESTLQRWIEGRAQAPLRAFLAALEFVMQDERRNGTPVGDAASDTRTLVFRLGPLAARCARCDCEEFCAAEAGRTGLTSVLLCRSCGVEVVHGNLLAQLARDAVHHSRAVAVRTRRAVDSSRQNVARGEERIAQTRQRLDSSRWCDPDKQT